MDHEMSLEDYIIGIVTDQIRLEGREAPSGNTAAWVGFSLGCITAGAVFVGVLGLVVSGMIREE